MVLPDHFRLCVATVSSPVQRERALTVFVRAARTKRGLLRYDVCVIGAGADGLAAAATLGLAGLKTIVVERAAAPGGRMQTREFHPGFRASPFTDELAPIPREIHWAFDLARRGAIFLSAAETDARVAAALARAYDEADAPPRRKSWLHHAPPPTPWPGEDLASLTLRQAQGEGVNQSLMLSPSKHEANLESRTLDPGLIGTALHLLAPTDGGMVAGGLGKLADALAAAARDAGAEILPGTDVADIRSAKSRATGVGLSTGTEIEARAIISTLDLKRTYLSLFQWNALPKPVIKRVSAWRMGGGTARVLFALAGAPARCGAIAADCDTANLAAAYAAWRAGLIPEKPPASLRIVSACDPSLAPRGAAVLTVTLASIPFRLFDGAWTREKRDVLRDRARAAAEAAFGPLDVLAADVIAPPDIEEALGATEGDLWGGEIASDQMLDLRPGPRTDIRGLYLAGPSSAAGPLATCASGVAAARAVLADLKAGRFK